jgi:hypothetical protein
MLGTTGIQRHNGLRPETVPTYRKQEGVQQDCQADSQTGGCKANSQFSIRLQELTGHWGGVGPSEKMTVVHLDHLAPYQVTACDEQPWGGSRRSRWQVTTIENWVWGKGGEANHVTGTYPQKRNNSKTVDYLGQAALRREQSSIFAQSKNCDNT